MTVVSRPSYGFAPVQVSRLLIGPFDAGSEDSHKVSTLSQIFTSIIDRISLLGFFKTLHVMH